MVTMQRSEGRSGGSGMPGNRPGRLATALAVTTTVVTSLPVFLVGGLSVQMSDDIGLTLATLGSAVASYWVGSAVFSSLGGSLSQRFGARSGMLTASALGLVALVGIAAATPVWFALIPWLVVAGAANGIGHPPSNTLIVAAVSGRNRAFAFGVKQAAIPLATLVAGASIPLFGLTVGWRWTFAIVAIVPLVLLPVVALVVPRTLGRTRPVNRRSERGGRIGSRLRLFLVLASAASFLGSAQANVIGAFTVSSATAAGFTDASAGLLLTVASAVGVIVRPVSGIAADRGIGGTMATVSLMMAAGAIGLAGMATGLPVAFAIGCVLAFGLGWGWNGLSHYVVSKVSHPHTAAATGFVQSGAYVGCALGPFLFGFVFGGWGSTLGWILAAVVAALGALLALIAHILTPRPAEGDTHD
jgi:predicted MFS family arabinose efflux permease